MHLHQEKDEDSMKSLREVNRSPMASIDEDAFFGRDIGSPALDEASDTSDGVDGIIDQDEAIFGPRDAQWNIMFKKLQDYYGKHGHCELFWAVKNRFNFILDTPTKTSSLSP
jgi:hypothetical protein